MFYFWRILFSLRLLKIASTTNIRIIKLHGFLIDLLRTLLEAIEG